MMPTVSDSRPFLSLAERGRPGRYTLADVADERMLPVGVKAHL